MLRLLLRATAIVAVVALTATAGLSATSTSTPSIKAGLDLANIDHTCKACDDFNQFATGNWSKLHPIPAAYPSYGNFEILQDQNDDALHAILESAAANTSASVGSNEQKIGAFYRSCMNEPAIEAADLGPLKAELAKIDAIASTADVNAEIAHIDRIGTAAGWGLGAAPDRKNSSRTILSVSPGQLALPDRDYYLKDDDRSKKLRAVYATYIAATEGFRGIPDAQAQADAQAIVALETEFAKARPPRADLRDPAKTYHPMTVADLQKIAPDVAWPTYLGRFLATPDTKFNVTLPASLSAFDKLLVATPLPVWKGYLAFFLINAYSETLPKRYVDAAFAVQSAFTGSTEQLPRWKRCVQQTDGQLGEALGEVYVKKYFPPAAKARALSLVENLQTTLGEDIPTLSWMSSQTKTYALKKLTSFGKKIGYPDRFIDYSAVTITDGPYVGNALATRSFGSDREAARIGRVTDRTTWNMSPPTVNAYYRSSYNDITFPAGILRPPFFSPLADDAVNYGAIGAVIGHEMTHGFDDSGRKFDADGNQVDWWQPTDSVAFDTRAKCIVDEFSSFDVVPGLKGNGKLEQGEAIADLGGITIAYRAFQKTAQYKAHQKIDGYTPEQRFFLAYGQVWAGAIRPEFAQLLAASDPHPLGKWRVIGTLSNFPAFAKAFACPATAAMVRKNRCEIW
jgi:putative endopeptidase